MDHLPYLLESITPHKPTEDGGVYDMISTPIHMNIGFVHNSHNYLATNVYPQFINSKVFPKCENTSLCVVHVCLYLR